MYLRPDEVAKVLENAGFERVYTVNEAYGYQKGRHYVYVNRESYMGRTALIIHPSQKDKSIGLSMPTALIKTSINILNSLSIWLVLSVSIMVLRMVLVQESCY